MHVLQMDVRQQPAFVDIALSKKRFWRSLVAMMDVRKRSHRSRIEWKVLVVDEVNL